ncbi:MAG TPA: ABC transporter ATP-binding protein [Planctomycetota bacterium]|nr:ABC transporter ATP-binding protein [Planctomycetota bacterium]
MILVEHLTRRFHELVAVDDVTLRVARGEVLGFLGPNGAGKSTTIRILTGFLPASSGRAEVDGHDVATQSLEVRRRLGYLPENVPLPGDARVHEYLEFRARLKGVPARERTRALDRVLAQCGLVEMRRRIIGQLSRGYRQRVGLADALVADPPVLILDEPTVGLDPGQRQEMLELVAGMRAHKTVLLSSHVLGEVEQACTRVAIIRRGRLLAQGTREELEAGAGRRGEVEIVAPRAGDRLAAALQGRGLAPRREPGSDACAVRLVSEEQGPALLAALVGEGLPIATFRPLTRSLQEIYLDLVRDAAA